MVVLDKTETTASPFLSVVVVSRNDNHGGDMLKRMQTMVSAFLEQCKRHNLDSELIIVEWNPPQGARLADVLKFDLENCPCEARFIEVPPHTHNKFSNSNELQLFQMIAKNVGIARARGKFILATNIDVIFNDELMSYLAKRNLDENCIYRIDRWDVGKDVPVNASVTQQLEYCKNNILRINKRSGIEFVNPPFTVAPVNTATKISLAHRIRIEAVIALRRLWYWYQFNLKVPLRLRRLLHACVPRNLTKKLFDDQFLHEFGNWPIKTLFPFLPQVSEYILPDVHTNACGDFTMMSSANWHKLNGYSEDPIFSLHIDSLLCVAAHYAGISEVVLEDPMRVYHIEHGNGWTPDGEQQLFERLEKQQIPFLMYQNFVDMAKAKSKKWKSSFKERRNWQRRDWGMSDVELPERTVRPYKTCYTIHRI
jgi:hypothetical protein